MPFLPTYAQGIYITELAFFPAYAGT